MSEKMRSLLASSFLVLIFFPWSAFPDSCLPPKLAKKVSAAGSVQARLEAYVSIAGKQNGQLALFLNRYRSWSEVGEPKQAVKEIQNNPLDILECAWTEMRKELEAWSPPDTPKDRDTLIQLDDAVAKTYRSFKAEDPPGTGPYADEIKSIQEIIEDVQALLKSRINRRTP